MAAVYNDSRDVFDNLSLKFSTLLYGRSEGDRIHVNKTLDELNSLDYRHPLVTQSKKAVLLLHQCCSIIPSDDSFLVAKCCHLINNLVSRQNVLVEGRTLQICINWALDALKQSSNEVTIDILVALENLIHSNTCTIYNLLPEIVQQNGTLLAYANKTPISTATLLAVQCLESCIFPPNELEKSKCNNVPQLQLCLKVFFKYLLCEQSSKTDDLLYCKLQSSCLRGLQNIIVQEQDILNHELGSLLGICRSYMVYHIRGVDFGLPQKLLPSLMNIPEAPQSLKKGGKIAKQRKQRTPTVRKQDTSDKEISRSDAADNASCNHFNAYTPAASTFAQENLSIPINNDKLRTSDSDFSDSDSALVARIGINQARLRQHALQLLLTIIKKADKAVMFGYWSSFLSVDSTSSTHNKITVCILKDPSAHGRSAALVVLLALLTRAKLYLSQAELSENDRSSFTTFSVTLGMMLKHLHYCLCLALAENCFVVLIQALKCLAALVQATPYHRLTAGLVTKIVRNVKPLVKHRDATVQVAALIVLGCVVASEPVVPETLQALLKDIQTVHQATAAKPLAASQHNNPDIEYADFSSSDENEPEAQQCKCPWLLEKCFSNLGVLPGNDEVVPLPVKEESLQVISAMNRHYFSPMLAPQLATVTKALESCLSDRNVVLQKHAGRAVDFTGQALQAHLSSAAAENKEAATVQRGLAFWQSLLGGPLVGLLQNEEDATARAVGCDCLSNVGAHIFEQLPRDKQILCITLLFACSRDEENVVRGAAVRALAICVLYPSLREDVGFVVDTAEAICRTIEDQILAVRVKSSWSLGNLSDALVLNANEPSIDSIPDSLFLKLLRICVKITSDNDKIKSNAVRALGSLLLLVTEQMLQQRDFKVAAENGLEALVKCCSTGSNMKVRWNSCYALGNALKNPVMYSHLAFMLQTVFSTLNQLIIDFSNFKVRINAALALSMPANRQFYGDCYFSVWKCLLLALDNSQNMDNYAEYRHRDNLVEQLCLTISHFVTLLEEEDLGRLEELLQLHIDSLHAHMTKVQDRLLPEKSALLINAASHLGTFKQRAGVVQMLLKVYTNI